VFIISAAKLINFHETRKSAKSISSFLGIAVLMESPYLCSRFEMKNEK